MESNFVWFHVLRFRRRFRRRFLAFFFPPLGFDVSFLFHRNPILAFCSVRACVCVSVCVRAAKYFNLIVILIANLGTYFGFCSSTFHVLSLLYSIFFLLQPMEKKTKLVQCEPNNQTNQPINQPTNHENPTPSLRIEPIHSVLTQFRLMTLFPLKNMCPSNSPLKLDLAYKTSPRMRQLLFVQMMRFHIKLINQNG